MEQSTCWWS